MVAYPSSAASLGGHIRRRQQNFSQVELVRLYYSDYPL